MRWVLLGVLLSTVQLGARNGRDYFRPSGRVYTLTLNLATRYVSVITTPHHAYAVSDT
jgi:hypothetical protein